MTIVRIMQTKQHTKPHAQNEEHNTVDEYSAEKKK
jgi:hypothetical protein